MTLRTRMTRPADSTKPALARVGDGRSGGARSANVPRALLVLLFAAPLAALAIALLAPARLPFVDFPQHVALISIWERLDRGDPSMTSRYQVNLLTPYVTGVVLAHALAGFVGPELAVRLVLFLSLAAVPLATLAVLRAYGRPPELAIAAFAVAFAWVTFMGFVPWLVAVPLIVVGPALVRHIGSSRRAWAALGLVAVAVFATHALALPVFTLVAITTALGAPNRRDRLLRLVRVVAALIPTVALGAIWALGRARAPNPDPRDFTFGDPLARLSVARYLFGESTSEQRVLIVVVGLAGVALGAAWLVRRGSGGTTTQPTAGGPRPDRPPVIQRLAATLRDRPLAWPFLALAAAYAVAPTTALDAYGLWQRFAPIAFVLGIGLVPWPTERRPRLVLAVALSVVASYASLATLSQSAAFDRQVAGLDSVLAGLPDGERLFYEQPTVAADGVGVRALRHVSAVYLTMHGGDTDYNFAMFPHMVVRLAEPRVLLTEPATYAFDLRFGACPSVAGLPLGDEVAHSGDWHVFAVRGPIVRPSDAAPPDSAGSGAAC